MNKKKKISAVIFDCDGVMFDSRQANTSFYNHILAHFKLPSLQEKDMSMVHMLTADESVRYIFRGTPYVKEAQAYRMELDYAPFIKDMIIEPGLKELLEYLKPRFRLAVATNRSNTIGKVLESFGLEGFFDIVVSSLDVHIPKPHPETIYKICDFFGIGPEQCIYIGDSEVDYAICQAADVPLVAYRNATLETPFHIETLSQMRTILSLFP